MASITAAESSQVQEANASGRPPAVFVHGLWLLASSWDRWAELFEQAGYASVRVSWPGDAETVEQARANPQSVAGRKLREIAAHVAEVIGALNGKPIVVGHSFGGLLAQMMAARGLSAATAAIDPAPFRGVLPLPLSTLRTAMPVLSNPANRRRAVSLTFEQFRYGWANALSEQEARQLHESFHVPGTAAPLFEAALANVNPRTAAQLDTRSPARGPLLIISGAKDHTVPHAIAHASYKLERRNPGVTEFAEIPDRGHSLTIDSGWREVADTALEFLGRNT
jgi:pimeloyl-ACP methyl ester carboxylesterase